jgi:hypothetical protein
MENGGILRKLLSKTPQVLYLLHVTMSIDGVPVKKNIPFPMTQSRTQANGVKL